MRYTLRIFEVYSIDLCFELLCALNCFDTITCCVKYMIWNNDDRLKFKYLWLVGLNEHGQGGKDTFQLHLLSPGSAQRQNRPADCLQRTSMGLGLGRWLGRIEVENIWLLVAPYSPVVNVKLEIKRNQLGWSTQCRLAWSIPSRNSG